MPIRHRELLATALSCCITVLLHAQQPSEDAPPSPLQLVAAAERLLADGNLEPAVLRLWRALDVLRTRERSAADDAAFDAASALLAKHDPLDAARRQAFEQVATHQVAIAKSYRLKRWYETALDRLDVAAQFAPEATAKERRLTLAKLARDGKAATSAEPAPRDEPADEPSLLQREMVELIDGQWTERDGHLFAPPHTGKEDRAAYWQTRKAHEDHEIITEFRGVAAQLPFDLGLSIGNQLHGQKIFSLRAQVGWTPGSRQWYCSVYRIEGMAVEELATRWYLAPATADTFHRLSMQVRGKHVQVRLDDHEPFGIEQPAAVRGTVGLVTGADKTGGAVEIRSLRVEPLPVDRPDDATIRARNAERRRNRIDAASARATELLSKKQPEPAARALREALAELPLMPEGILRDSLTRTLQTQLQDADPIADKRAAAAKACAAVLGDLADRHVEGSRPNLARELAERAAHFDPKGQQQHIRSIDAAIAAWVVAQQTARAAELLPPADDGQTFRELFGSARPLASGMQPMTLDGARVTCHFAAAACSVWMPTDTTLTHDHAGVWVRLPAAKTQAGIVLDVAGPEDYCAAFVERKQSSVHLAVVRRHQGRWRVLGVRRAELEAWRLDGFHELAIERTPTGLKARTRGAELIIQQAQLGQRTRRIGLFASSDAAEAVTFELHALSVARQ